MKYKAPGKCPVCGEKLTITKLSCPRCSTVIEGDFQPCEFCRLPEEDLSFIKVFIKNRGNIKDIEKEMGISYPTVRGKLDAAIRALGYEVFSKQDEEDVLREKEKKEQEKSEVLAKLYAGELSAKEAADKIKAL